MFRFVKVIIKHQVHGFSAGLTLRGALCQHEMGGPFYPLPFPFLPLPLTLPSPPFPFPLPPIPLEVGP